MIKRALLIGSQTYGLSGANPDVHLMAETLESRGFECRVRIDDDASRQGMIEGYEQLISDTPEGSEDPVVVYYSGHGGRTALTGWESLQRRGQRSHLRYLVPFDMDASTESDFRGLLAEELSALQRRLTIKTANVTTILDCCHAGTMSRDPTVLPKTVGREFSIEAALPLLEKIDASAGPVTRLDDSNPLAVRLVACDPLQSAYERESSLGGRHGALTEQFVLLVTGLGDRPLTWRVLADRLRRNITTTLPMQRPEVEGPADRLLFSLATRSAAGAVPATVRDGVVQIDSARVLGVTVGDTYNLRAEDETPLGTARVVAIDGDRAELDVQPSEGAPPMQAAVVAVPLRTTRTTPVSIEVPFTAARDLVRAKVEESTSVRPAADGEAPLACIVEQDGLVVLDPEGFEVQQAPFGADADGAQQAVALVERIAKAERVRALVSGGEDAGLVGKIGVELTSHDDEDRHPRARTGERLYVGERVSVTITNSSDRDVYVGLLDVDTAYHVQALNDDEPSGWRLRPGDTKVVGGDHGAGLEWDEGVPDDRERPESFIVITSTKPLDFRLLETTRGDRGLTPQTELDSLLEEARSGQRGWPTATNEADSGYRVEVVDFYLVPGARPTADEPEFAIREMPNLALRTIQPRAPVPPPSRLAVRLVSLKVLHNRALFKAAVRLDALVITGGDEQVVANPFTYRFPSIADGDLLPADNVQLFLGPVQDFVDIAIWLNRDDSKGKDLAELFEHKVKGADTKDALTVVGGLVLAGPQVAVAAGAVAAVAAVVRIGAELVNAAVGKEIGLYRTSFLPFERLGLGRHPADGLRRAQGIEFAFEVVDPG